jgi:hypothetical protein
MSPSFSPTDLHAENVGRLRPEDVVIASYPGSGAALIGNVLLSLGLAYVDPYTEVVDDHGGGPVPERVDYRARLAATHAADTSEDRSAVAARRLVKTHRHPDEFPARPEQIVALVRDPRDAVHSYYRWRLGFSEESESGSFEEFLERRDIDGERPADAWASFCERWRRASGEAGAADGYLEIRFERLKSDPVAEVERLLAFIGAQASRDEVQAAVDASSFDRMREHEARVAGGAGSGAMIMRRGRVDEWTEWFGPPLWETFRTERVRRVAAVLGYDLSIPVDQSGPPMAGSR